MYATLHIDNGLSRGVWIQWNISNFHEFARMRMDRALHIGQGFSNGMVGTMEHIQFSLDYMHLEKETLISLGISF